jgi:membrane associated rhomboid family serine protease
MSIADRDYYYQRGNPGWGRSPHEQSLRWTAGTPPVVKWLLIFNIAVFIVAAILTRSNAPFFQRKVAVEQQMIETWRGPREVVQRYELPSQFDLTFGLLPSNLIGRGYVWQLITYQFLHADFLHLFFNMFTLLMIGRYVEQQIGSRPFLRLYLLGGIFAGLANLLTHLFTDMPTIGASGSICAVIAAFGLMNPHARLTIFILFFPLFIRARTFVIVFALITAFFAFTGGRETIADLAHLGGLVFGWMYVYNILLVRRLVDGRGHGPHAHADHTWRDAAGAVRRWWRQTRRPSRLYKGQPYEDADYRAASPRADQSAASAPDQSAGTPAWDERMDAILDKMAREGMHTLTDEEWTLLDRYRRGAR